MPKAESRNGPQTGSSGFSPVARSLAVLFAQPPLSRVKSLSLVRNLCQPFRSGANGLSRPAWASSPPRIDQPLSAESGVQHEHQGQRRPVHRARLVARFHPQGARTSRPGKYVRNRVASRVSKGQPSTAACAPMKKSGSTCCLVPPRFRYCA